MVDRVGGHLDHAAVGQRGKTGGEHEFSPGSIHRCEAVGGAAGGETRVGNNHVGVLVISSRRLITPVRGSTNHYTVRISVVAGSGDGLGIARGCGQPSTIALVG